MEANSPELASENFKGVLKPGQKFHCEKNAVEYPSNVELNIEYYEIHIFLFFMLWYFFNIF